MKIEDYIVVFDDALPDQFCDDLVFAYDNEPEKEVIDTDTHNFSEVNILKTPSFDNFKSEFIDKMVQCQLAYKNRVKAYLWPERPMYDAPVIKKYEQGKGFEDWRLGASDVETSKRLLSMIWYLNDVEEGGETRFIIDEQIIRVQPKKGRVVCFPPNFMFPYKREIPITDSQYTISSFVVNIDND